MRTNALLTVMALLGAASLPLSAQIGVRGGNNSGGTGQGPAGPAGTAGSGYAATSTTGLTIAVGTATFTTQSGLAYSAGARVRASSAASGSNYMEGLVTSYSGTSLAINVDSIGGSGIKNDWNINIAGSGAAASHTVPFAAAMVFTGTSTSFDLFKTTLTGTNTSATLTGNAGTMMELDILQDGTGRAFVAPANIIPACPVSTVPNVTTVIKGSFDGTNLIQSGCTNNDVATFISGPERAPVTGTSTGQGTLTFDGSSHTLGYYANNSANRHIVPRCAGSTDQCASSDLSDSANLARTSAPSAFGAFLYDFSGSAWKLPTAAGFVSSAASMAGLDLSNSNVHFWDGAADRIGALISGSPANNDCAKFVVTGSNIRVTTSGSGCGGSSSIATTTNVLVGNGSGGAVAAAGTGSNCLHVDGSSASCSGTAGAATDLSNLTTTTINQTLLPQSTKALGSASANWSDLYLNLSGTYGTGYVHFIGTPTAARTISVADANTATVQARDCSSTVGQVVYKVDANGLPACTAALGHPIFSALTNFAFTFGSAGFIPLGGGSTTTAENIRQMPMPSAGTIKSAFVNLSSAQSATGSLSCTWRKNGADTSLVVTIPASSPIGVYSDLTDSFTYAAGDLISIRCQQNTSGTSGAVTGISNMVYNQ